ncbi:MAG TPA: HAD-IIIC family phosphatase [Actinospica sp.]|jgi:methoxymalonate biosynthesis protein|nr:HAD-IIIC family phosphatase [Actinospica sp.]
MPGTTAVKCVVWDLDGTVWDGTLLEGDSPELRPGVLDTLVELDRRGILHSVASRNDHDQAWQHLEKLGVAEYFLHPQIGWGRKPDSVQAIVDAFGFAADTFAFIDDQPVEIAEMEMRQQDVRCYAAAEAARLPDLPEFTPDSVTAESANRRASYRAIAAREQARAEFQGPDEDFLVSLEIEMSIVRATSADLDRLSELTVRTSQLNATGIPYSREQLDELSTDPAHAVLAVSMRDRFGSHGAIGVMLLDLHPKAWRLRLLTTSCRVMSFGAGSVLLRWLTGRAAEAGVHLAADLRRTGRNRQMEIAYAFAGFEPIACDCLETADEEGLLHLVPGAVPEIRHLTVIDQTGLGAA